MYGARGDALRTRTPFPGDAASVCVHPMGSVSPGWLIELPAPGKERAVSSCIGTWNMEDLSVLWAIHTHDQEDGPSLGRCSLPTGYPVLQRIWAIVLISLLSPWVEVGINARRHR